MNKKCKIKINSKDIFYLTEHETADFFFFFFFFFCMILSTVQTTALYEFLEL